MLAKWVALFLCYTTMVIPISEIGLSRKTNRFNFYMLEYSESHTLGYSRKNEQGSFTGLIKDRNVIYGVGNLPRSYCFWLWDSCFNTKRRLNYRKQEVYSAHILFDTQPVFIQSSAKEDGSALFRFLKKQHAFVYGFATTTSGFYGVFQYAKKQQRLYFAANENDYELYGEYFFRKAKLYSDLRKKNQSAFKKLSLTASNYELAGLYLSDISRALWAKYNMNDWNLLIFSENMQEGNLQVGRSIQQGPIEYNYQLGLAPDAVLAGIGARHYRLSYDCIYFFTTSIRQTNLLFALRGDSSKVRFFDWSYLAENCYHRLSYQSPELNLSLHFGEALEYFFLEFRYQAV